MCVWVCVCVCVLCVCLWFVSKYLKTTNKSKEFQELLSIINYCIWCYFLFANSYFVSGKWYFYLMHTHTHTHTRAHSYIYIYIYIYICVYVRVWYILVNLYEKRRLLSKHMPTGGKNKAISTDKRRSLKFFSFYLVVNKSITNKTQHIFSFSVVQENCSSLLPLFLLSYAIQRLCSRPEMGFVCMHMNMTTYSICFFSIHAYSQTYIGIYTHTSLNIHTELHAPIYIYIYIYMQT